MISLYHTPSLIRFIYPELIWNIPVSTPTVFITFDDGPTPDVTEFVIHALNQYNFKATFFCLGKNIELFPEITQSILKSDNLIGNHGYSHLNGWKTNTSDYFIDFYKGLEISHSNIFRPPYGKITRKQIRLISSCSKIIMWDILSHDYLNVLDLKQAFKLLVKYTKNGSIIVFHDSKKAERNLRKLLPMYLKYLADTGFVSRSVTL